MVTVRVGVRHSFTSVNVTHMSIVNMRNVRIQGFSTLITKVTFFWWIMNIFQHVHVAFVLNYCCHGTTFPVPYVFLFQIQCIAS